jgi:hypothetical protein
VTGGELSPLGISYEATTTYGDCESGERLISITAMSRDGAGWAGGTYEIKNASGITVLNGTMSGSVGDDSMRIMHECLMIGSYTAALFGTDTQLPNMALEVDTCNIYLSQYNPTSTFTINATATSNYCSQCSDYSLLLTMIGSFYGVPYGWRGDSHYQVLQREGEVEYEGVLVTGMIRAHSYCLATGTYEIRLNDIPLDDDGWLDDYYAAYANSVGVQEYELYISDIENNVMINSNSYAVLTVDGTSGKIVVVGGKSDDDDGTISDGVLAAIFTVSVVIVACCIGVVVYLIFCRNGKKSNGDQTQAAVEATSSPIQQK